MTWNPLRYFANRYYLAQNKKLAGRNDSLTWQIGDARTRIIALQAQLTEALADSSRLRAAVANLRAVHEAENTEVDARHEAALQVLRDQNASKDELIAQLRAALSAAGGVQ